MSSVFMHKSAATAPSAPAAAAAVKWKIALSQLNVVHKNVTATTPQPHSRSTLIDDVDVVSCWSDVVPMLLAARSLHYTLC